MTDCNPVSFSLLKISVTNMTGNTFLKKIYFAVSKINIP
jgi:hypothetical protein